MPAGPAPYVGERLREERTRRGVSVRALARELGVSASLISQIETGKSQPSVSTLYAITTALQISVEDVFGPSRATDDGAAQAQLGALGPERGQRVGPVVRPGQRQVLQLDSGVTWERLGQLQHPHVDFLLITYASGGTSSSNGGLMRHGGCEYGHLISGSLILTLGFEDHVLAAGDSVSFESRTPHRYRNDGPEPAVGVWFVTET